MLNKNTTAKIHSLEYFFDGVAGVLLGDALELLRFIIFLENLIGKSIDLMKKKLSHSKTRQKS